MTTAACQRCFRRWRVDPTVANLPGCPACGGGLRAVDPSLQAEAGLLLQQLFRQEQLFRQAAQRIALARTWILTDADRDFLRCQRIDPDR